MGRATGAEGIERGCRHASRVDTGKGLTLSTAAIASEHLNSIIEIASAAKGIPVQAAPCGRDTGTDAIQWAFY